MDNVSGHGNPKNNQKKKKKWCRWKALIEEKNSFDELISKLDTTEERISELEDISIESSKIK